VAIQTDYRPATAPRPHWNRAVISARAGEDEALGRLEDLARRLRDYEAEVLAERRTIARRLNENP